VLGALALREPVGIRRWTAVTIGFIGALIIIRPGMGVIHPAVMLVLVAALLFALRQILSRALSATDPVATTVAYTALAGSFVLTIPLPFFWQWPATGTEIALLTSIAVLAGLAELLTIKALEAAQAVVVAPVQYTLLIWGTMYGYLVFGQLQGDVVHSVLAVELPLGIQRVSLPSVVVVRSDPRVPLGEIVAATLAALPAA